MRLLLFRRENARLGSEHANGHKQLNIFTNLERLHHDLRFTLPSIWVWSLYHLLEYVYWVGRHQIEIQRNLVRNHGFHRVSKPFKKCSVYFVKHSSVVTLFFFPKIEKQLYTQNQLHSSSAYQNFLIHIRKRTHNLKVSEWVQTLTLHNTNRNTSWKWSLHASFVPENGYFWTVFSGPLILSMCIFDHKAQLSAAINTDPLSKVIENSAM